MPARAVGAKGVRVVRQKQVQVQPLEQREAPIGGLLGGGLSAYFGVAGGCSVGCHAASGRRHQMAAAAVQIRLGLDGGRPVF